MDNEKSSIRIIVKKYLLTGKKLWILIQSYLERYSMKNENTTWYQGDMIDLVLIYEGRVFTDFEASDGGRNFYTRSS